jgi:putative ABC transport system permease protein
MANVFLLDIQPAQRDGVMSLIAGQPGVESKPDVLASVAARLTKIRETPVEKMELTGFGRRFRQTRTVTWSDRLPDSTVLAQGKWWTEPRAGAVSLAEDAAKVLGVKVGDRLEFTASGQTFEARVAAIHRTEAVRPGAAAEFVFSSATLQDLPAIYFGGLRVRPAEVAALQRALYAKFPTVTVINVADVIQTIQDVVDQIALVIRFISAFAILAGVIILASSVAGTRFRRIREVVILKTIGATRRRISGIFSAEFLILGATAGLMGSLLASCFSNAVLIRFFEGEFRFDSGPILVSTVAAALIANAAGWLASARILGQKPLEVLRGE